MTERQPASGRSGCPQCGAAHEQDQEYCLECGRRLTRRDPWSGPPTWVWVVIALLIAMGAAGAIAGLATRDGGSSPEEALPATTAVPETTETAPQVEVPLTVTLESPDETGPTAGEPAGTEPAEPTPAEPAPGGTPVEPAAPADSGLETVTLPTGSGGGGSGGGGSAGGRSDGGSGAGGGSGSATSWPAGQSGYTAVLASIPTSQGRAAADSVAARAKSAGLPEVGVLDSSEHSSLRPGYWVVFSGVYSTSQEAKAGAQKARTAGFPDAYARAISG